jgi:TonB family protein
MCIARATIPFCLGLLALAAETAAAQEAQEIRDATVAMGFDAKSRCPDLLHTDAQDGTGALILFVVGPTGVPSQAAVKSSSGSADLDAAAVACVLRLRFLPVVHAGDGNAVSSWQEIAWKWGRQHSATPPPGVVGGALAPVTSPAPEPARSRAGSAEVRVCVDAGGRLAQDPALTRSSGDSALDAATLRVARSAAEAYPAPGCVRLTLSAAEAPAKDAR